MTLPASGAISFGDVNTELGLSATAQISLGDAAVRGLFGIASGAIDMNTGHGKSNIAVGQILYTNAGATTYYWTCPSGVTSVSVVCVGGGGTTSLGGGGGGGLSFINNYPVTPGTVYTVQTGVTDNYFGSLNTVTGGRGVGMTSGQWYTVGYNGTVNPGWGWAGGQGGLFGDNGSPYSAGGGGAGGYASGAYGGQGAIADSAQGGPAGNGSGGSGAGGESGPGGGVGVLGQGTSGIAPGGPGSGGVGKLYGGGGDMAAQGGQGAVRIIWPGATRQFPSTNTGNM